jgi:hypothetical protein
MKTNFRNAPRGFSAGLVSLAAFAAVVTFMPAQTTASILALDLGAAASFAALAGSGITIAGTVYSSTLVGDIGSFPTPAITGLENLVITGINHAADAVTQEAHANLNAAYIDAAGRVANVQFVGGHDMVGMILISGVYNSPSSLLLSGTMTLDAQGDPDAVWIIRMGSTLTTASASQVNLIGGAKAQNVFWQVGSSATLGTGSDFSGSILANQSITLTTGATIAGRALALNGAVTMDHNSILVPEPGSALLGCAGLGGCLAFRRRSGRSV